MKLYTVRYPKNNKMENENQKPALGIGRTRIRQLLLDFDKDDYFYMADDEVLPKHYHYVDLEGRFAHGECRISRGVLETLDTYLVDILRKVYLCSKHKQIKEDPHRRTLRVEDLDFGHIEKVVDENEMMELLRKIQEDVEKLQKKKEKEKRFEIRQVF